MYNYHCRKVFPRGILIASATLPADKHYEDLMKEKKILFN